GWFDAGSRIEIGALRQDGDISLKGWNYTSPSQAFGTNKFHIDPSLGSDNELDAYLDLVTIDNQGYWSKAIANLSQPVSVFWDYGDTIHLFHLGIGEPLDLSTNAATRSAIGQWRSASLLEGPPG